MYIYIYGFGFGVSGNPFRRRLRQAEEDECNLGLRVLA